MKKKISLMLAALSIIAVGASSLTAVTASAKTIQSVQVEGKAAMYYMSPSITRLANSNPSNSNYYLPSGFDSVNYGYEGVIYNISSSLNVRSGPASAYNAIGSVYNAESLYVVASATTGCGRWYFVMYWVNESSGISKAGWISADYCQIKLG